ncbi:Pr6Pr family membrane protein [Nesterenkonia suensis]
MAGDEHTGDALSAQQDAVEPRPFGSIRWEESTTARGLHAVVALLCAGGLATSVYLGWTTETSLPAGVGYHGGFAAGWEHTLNQPAYFTVLSGFLACLTSAMLAVRVHRTSTVFHALRLCAVVSVIITGVVFNLLLRGPDVLTGVRWVNDTVLHVIVPILVPAVWLLIGPRGVITGKVMALSLLVPLGWLAVTLGRGPLIDWYPYDILDVPGMGYPGVGVYIGAILGGYLLVACLLGAVDRLLARLLG